MAGDNGNFQEAKKPIDGSGFDCSLFTNIFLPSWGTKIAKAIYSGGTLQSSLSCLYEAPTTLDPWRPWVCTPRVSPVMHTQHPAPPDSWKRSHGCSLSFQALEVLLWVQRIIPSFYVSNLYSMWTLFLILYCLLQITNFKNPPQILKTLSSYLPTWAFEYVTIANFTMLIPYVFNWTSHCLYTA